MKYRILKIEKISDSYFDVDYQEMTIFRKPKTFKKIRTEYSCALGVIVSTGAYIHNFAELVTAYSDEIVDFTFTGNPLPIVHTTGGKAIY